MSRRRRGPDLDTVRPLRLIEEMDGLVCAAIDKKASRDLGSQLMMFHLAMMAAFITVVLAPVAWIAALFNILLTPKVASWRIACNQHAVTLEHLYSRAEPTIDQVQAGKSSGTSFFGLRERQAPIVLPFSELTDIGWNDYCLWFATDDGRREEVVLELTSPEDIARLGTSLREIRARALAGFTQTEAESDRRRAALAELQQKQAQHP